MTLVNAGERLEDPNGIVWGKREHPELAERAWMWGAFYMASMDVVHDSVLNTSEVDELRVALCRWLCTLERANLALSA